MGFHEQSLKCSECGSAFRFLATLAAPPCSSRSRTLLRAELFRNQALAQYHSTKSGHTEFEESTEELKPLTEEEKAEKLKEVRRSGLTVLCLRAVMNVSSTDSRT